jgi:uncharacterized membrane protein (DUF106 family)
MGFADRMAAVNDAVRDSARNRTAAIAEINENTQTLVADTQELLKKVSADNKSRAAQIAETLRESREKRRAEVASMRKTNTEQLRELRKRLEELFASTRTTRQEAVQSMLHSFQESRKELAEDLAEAGRIWGSRDHS